MRDGAVKTRKDAFERVTHSESARCRLRATSFRHVHIAVVSDIVKYAVKYALCRLHHILVAFQRRTGLGGSGTLSSRCVSVYFCQLLSSSYHLHKLLHLVFHIEKKRWIGERETISE